MSEGNMDGNDTPTRADVEAMNRWSSLGDSVSIDRARTEKTYSNGRIVFSLPVAEAAPEVKESVRAREERHAEGQAKIIRAFVSALGLSHGQGLPELRRDSTTGENEPE